MGRKTIRNQPRIYQDIADLNTTAVAAMLATAQIRMAEAEEE